MGQAEGVFQRRILRTLKEHGWPTSNGDPCLTLPELRKHVYGRRRPGWTHNWTLERALRSLEGRGRITRRVVSIGDMFPAAKDTVVVQYLRPKGIPYLVG